MFRRGGSVFLADQILPIMFGRAFINDPAREVEKRKWRELMLRNDRIAITRAVSGVINRASVFDRLNRIERPTLIIVGEEDAATPPEHSERLAREIKGSKLVRIPRAGHISTVEDPKAVNMAIDGFLGQL